MRYVKSVKAILKGLKAWVLFKNLDQGVLFVEIEKF